MNYVTIVTVLALLEFLWLGALVGKARVNYKIAAPAVTGHEMFERHFRVHMNTQEQLVLFLPAMWMFALYLDERWAAGLGLVFIIGRAIYAKSYLRDPKSRSLGFALSAVPTLILLAGALFGAVKNLIAVE